MIGTSGWTYYDWTGKFYPTSLKSRDFLKFYSQYFPTTEVNYSFYHLPRPTTYQNWAAQVPENFIFAVKASRFITHIKRLHAVSAPWRKFIKNAEVLGRKLGPILFQFPPSFKQNLDRLERFLKLIYKRKTQRSDGYLHKFSLPHRAGEMKLEYQSMKSRLQALQPQVLQTAFEFRHPSWFQKSTYELLEKYNACLVIADSGGRYPTEFMRTADFLYFRFHGPATLFSSLYSDKALKTYTEKIKKIEKGTKASYIYFNNDVAGYALNNARTLTKLLEC